MPSEVLNLGVHSPRQRVQRAYLDAKQANNTSSDKDIKPPERLNIRPVHTCNWIDRNPIARRDRLNPIRNNGRYLHVQNI